MNIVPSEIFLCLVKQQRNVFFDTNNCRTPEGSTPAVANVCVNFLWLRSQIAAVWWFARTTLNFCSPIEDGKWKLKHPQC